MSTGNGIHAGHRQRMKERFLQTGLDGFSEHEIFEVLLYYAIPRKDTNELSHLLIERFGSLAGVFEADYDELLTVEGMGENAATLIKLVSAVWRAYALESSKSTYVYDSIQKVGQYAVNLFIGATIEKVYAMMFDNKMRLLDTVLINQGTVNGVHINSRLIAEKALKRNAASVILLHNHPNGIPNPSIEDRALTNQLMSAFEYVGINIIEHIIVSGPYYSPIIGKRAIRQIAAGDPAYNFDNFYDVGEGIHKAEYALVDNVLPDNREYDS